MMMKQSRNALMGLLALSAAAAMPMALAQEQEQKSADPASATSTGIQPNTVQSPVASTAATDTTKPKTWADVDRDKDGNISKTEAAAEPAVGKMFDLADTNKDSKLTPDEYKAYVAKANGAKAAGQGG